MLHVELSRAKHCFCNFTAVGWGSPRVQHGEGCGFSQHANPPRLITRNLRRAAEMGESNQMVAPEHAQESAPEQMNLNVAGMGVNPVCALNLGP